MVVLAPRNAVPPARIGVQPIAVAAVALVLVLFGIGSIALWRALSGSSPELERAAASRQLQARTAQVSEQLVGKTKEIEATQQESIDQLQVVQDQLQTMRRMLASQQAENKKLSEQVAAGERHVAREHQHHAVVPELRDGLLHRVTGTQLR